MFKSYERNFRTLIRTFLLEAHLYIISHSDCFLPYKSETSHALTKNLSKPLISPLSSPIDISYTCNLIKYSFLNRQQKNCQQKINGPKYSIPSSSICFFILETPIFCAYPSCFPSPLPIKCIEKNVYLPANWTSFSKDKWSECFFFVEDFETSYFASSQDLSVIHLI